MSNFVLRGLNIYLFRCYMSYIFICLEYNANHQTVKSSTEALGKFTEVYLSISDPAALFWPTSNLDHIFGHLFHLRQNNHIWQNKITKRFYYIEWFPYDDFWINPFNGTFVHRIKSRKVLHKDGKMNQLWETDLDWAKDQQPWRKNELILTDIDWGRAW